MNRSLEIVLNPRSIAIVGASEVSGKASERRTRSLLEGGYEGSVYLVNPKRSELFGRKAYPNLTQIHKEVDLVMIAVAAMDIDEMIKEIKGYKVLTGIRGEKPKDIEAIGGILTKLSEIAMDNPEIKEIDLNPVIVHEKGASIVDSRFILS